MTSCKFRLKRTIDRKEANDSSGYKKEESTKIVNNEIKMSKTNFFEKTKYDQFYKYLSFNNWLSNC